MGAVATKFKKDKELNFYKKEVEKQKSDILKLETIIRDFSENHDKYDEKINKEKEARRKKLLHELSKKNILTLVEKILKDKDVNIGYLPDFVEKQIYLNVFTIIIGLIENITEDIKVEILGHQLNLVINPKNYEKVKKIDTDNTIDTVAQNKNMESINELQNELIELMKNT